MADEFDRGIARLPAWLLLVAVTGTLFAATFYGLSLAGGFLLGSIGAYFNLRLVERSVNRLTQTAVTGGRTPGKRNGILLFIQFGLLVLTALVILTFSGFNKVAALCGFLSFPAAALLEIVYELITLKHR